MPLPYREFAAWILSDLSERTETEYADRITFSGNHITEQFVLQVKAENETKEHFVLRFKELWKYIPRHSDLSARIAFAVEAFFRAGETKWSAASLVLDQLERLPKLSAQEQLRWAKLGIPHKQIKPAIGTTRRGRRSKRKKTGFTAYYRQVETVRTQASRFRRKHTNFETLFESKFEIYRFQFCGDSHWCAEAEPAYQQRLAESEQTYGSEPGHPMTPLSRGRDASNVVLGNVLGLAWLYLLWGKYARAELFLRRAQATLEQALGADHPEVAWILTELGKCLAKQGRLDEAEPLYRRALSLGKEPQVRAMSYGQHEPPRGS